jgi:hypothetical protein
MTAEAETGLSTGLPVAIDIFSLTLARPAHPFDGWRTVKLAGRPSTTASTWLSTPPE